MCKNSNINNVQDGNLALNYVERKGLEEKLSSSFLSLTGGGRICFIKGKKGVGKSTVIKKMIEGRSDTLYYKCNEKDDRRTLINEAVPAWSKTNRFIILDDFEEKKVVRYPLNNLPFVQTESLSPNKSNLMIISNKTLVAEPLFVNHFIYNSATLKIDVTDITPFESRSLFPCYSFVDSSLLYMMTGGKAFIYSLFETTLSFKENVIRYYDSRELVREYFLSSPVGDYINPVQEKVLPLAEMLNMIGKKDEAMSMESVFFFYYLYPVLQGKRRYRDGEDFFLSNYTDMIFFLFSWYKRTNIEDWQMYSRLYDAKDKSYINVCRIMRDLGYMENGYPEELSDTRMLRKFEKDNKVTALTFNDNILEESNFR